jgi:hypothetical protein
MGQATVLADRCERGGGEVKVEVAGQPFEAAELIITVPAGLHPCIELYDISPEGNRRFTIHLGAGKEESE